MPATNTPTSRYEFNPCQWIRARLAARLLVLATLIPGLIFWSPGAMANPHGATVVHGDVSMSGGAGHLQINQGSQRAIINWESFSIQPGETTRFVQPNANAIALNRVTSGIPSTIQGQLLANGGVILINPNGIVVGPRGQIDITGMLVMSTLDMSNRDFLKGGSMRFTGDSGAGVVNYGAISSASGDVVLLGNFLQNHGSVSAPDGTVAFGAGGDIIVGQTVSGGRISVVAGGQGGRTGIVNTGDVNAAAAEFKAHGNVYALAIQNQGVVRANGYNFSGGKLTLEAGPQGSIVNTGQLVARNRDGSGGRVEISGGQVGLTGGSIDASGAPGRAGGTVTVEAGGVSVGEQARVEVGGTSGGRVSISGSGGADLAGTIDAVGSSGQGGRVEVTGSAVRVTETASIDASGLEGGEVRVGGGVSGGDPEIENANVVQMLGGSKIFADGSEGDGGSVVVFAEGSTLFEGEISAQAFGSVGNGGFVEVSGQRNLSLDGRVSTLAANGANGTFLIDPVDVVIHGPGGSGTMSDAALRGFVDANNVIIHTSGAGDSDGTITVNSGAKVVYDSPNSLTFLAHGSIFVNGDIKNIGSTDIDNTGHITLAAGWDGTLPLVLNDEVSAADFINLDGTPLEEAGRFGEWGASGSQVYLNEAGLEAVEVGSARGETNVFADVVQMRQGRAGGRFTQIGYRRVSDSRANDPGQFGGFFENPEDQIVDGDINVSGRSGVLMRPSDEFNAAEFGKIRERAYVMIGHGGIRRNDNNNVAVTWGTGFGYDSGVLNVADGDNSGDITVHAGILLEMTAGRLQSPVHIGHGGHGVGSGSGLSNAGGHTPFENQFITGDMSGDITVTAGFLSMEGGGLSDAPAQIGHGGYNVRGEHSGDIEVTTTLGGIRGIGAPNLGDIGPGNPTEWRWTNNRDRSYVQIGHGGVNAFHNDSMPNRSIQTPGNFSVHNSSFAGDSLHINPNTGLRYGHSGDVTVVSAGGVHMTATGNQAYAQIGHGGVNDRMSNRGDITVIAEDGDIIFDRIAIQLDRNGMDRRNVGSQAYVQIGHGGYLGTGGGSGDIDVAATGNIEFYAGRAQAYAQIGHGGSGADSTIWASGAQRHGTAADGTLSGDINVHAGGDIKFRSGFGTSTTAHSMIGHGGYRQRADILQPIDVNGVPISYNEHFGEDRYFEADGTPAFQIGGGAHRIEPNPDFDPDQPVSETNPEFIRVRDETYQGHHGNIVVTAGGSIDFRAGQVEGEILPGQEPFGIESNRIHNFTQIGHGGHLSWGDHWGTIDVEAGGDLILEGRGGWDGISIEGADAGPAGDPLGVNPNQRGTPRYASTEDNSGSGVGNYAMLGHGGNQASHRFNLTASRDSSGKPGEGIGVWGDSDITIDVGGDVVVRAAQQETVGPVLPTRLFRRGGGGVDIPIFYLTEQGVALETWLAANEAHPDYFDVQQQLFDMRIDLRTVTPEEGVAMSQHGGRLERVERDNGDLWFFPDPLMAAADSFAQIGNAGRSTNYQGGLLIGGDADGLGHRGDVTINAGGGIFVEAGDIFRSVGAGQASEIQVYTGAVGTLAGAQVGEYVPGGGDAVIRVGPALLADDPDAIGTAGGAGGTDRRGQHNNPYSHRNYAMIGLGGYQARGDHLGDIRITGGMSDDGTGLRIIGGDAEWSFAQVGHGGYQSGGYNDEGNLNNVNRLLGDIGDRGEIYVEVDGHVEIRGGGNERSPGVTALDTDSNSVPLNSNSIGGEARLGHGGYQNRATHSGDVTLISHEGGLDLVGGAGRRSSAVIGHGGHDARTEGNFGDIRVVTASDILLQGAVPFADPVTGMLSSTDRVDVQIGHGGYTSHARSGNLSNGVGVGGNHGTIEVISTEGSIVLRGGGDPTLTTNTDAFSQSLYTQIGHGGGVNTHGDHRGDILVSAGSNVEVHGGAGGRDSYTQIGHGGVQIQGNLSGDIQIIAGDDLIMNRGADTDIGGGGRDGSQLFNNWAAVGHGDHRRNQRNDGQGTRNGDIHISLGGSAYLSLPENRRFDDDAYTRPFADQVLIGHMDSRVSLSDSFRTVSGDTFIAVGRQDPFDPASGSFVAGSEATIASAAEGIFGELRLYLPGPASNLIDEGVVLNSDIYTRAPSPDGSRADEQIATEHEFGMGAFGELTASFLPAGDFPAHPFGLYNVYYSGLAPIEIPLPPELPPVFVPPFDPGFDFLSFGDPNTFDSFDRFEPMLGFDGYEGMLLGIAIDDAFLDEGEPTTGGWFLEDMLTLPGPGDDPASDSEALQSWRERKIEYIRERAGNKVGMIPMIYYVYDPGANRYSSFQVFGAPRSALPIANPTPE